MILDMIGAISFISFSDLLPKSIVRSEFNMDIYDQ